MFAYCANNSVNCGDPTGHAYQGIHEQINYNEYEHTYGGLRESAIGARPDYFNLWDFLTNSDEAVVLEADYFAFYKGALVIKVQSLDSSGFSFGIIGLGPNVDAETVKHEYGHFLHLLIIGGKNYLFDVAIPSLKDYYSEVPYAEYYSEPQEYIADILGGVNRENRGQPYQYSISDIEAILYFLLSIPS